MWIKRLTAFILVSALSLGINCFSVSCFADGDTLSTRVSYRAEDATVMVSGSCDGSVSVTVLPASSSPADLTDIYQKNYFDIINAEQGTYCSDEFTLSDASPSGLYTVYITDESGNNAANSFRFITVPVAYDLIAKINAASTAQDIRNIMESAPNDFGIDPTDSVYQSYAASAYEIFCEIRQKYTSANSGAVYDDFYAAFAMAQLRNADASKAKSVLEKWAVNLGFGHNADLTDSRLDADSASELYRLLAEEDYVSVMKERREKQKEVSFVPFFEEEKVLACVRTAKNWQGIKEVILTDFQEKCSSFVNASDEFPSLKSQESVFIAMSRETFRKFSDIAVAFDRAVSDQAKAEKNNQGGSSGSSSGGKQIGFPLAVDTNFSNEQKNFADLPTSHWAYSAVTELCGKQIVSGYPDNTFRPDSRVTRAEFVKLISAAFNLNAQGESTFPDVAADSWYAPYIASAASMGIVKGDESGNFCPDASVTRQDAAVMLERVLSYIGNTLPEGTLNFKDNAEISAYSSGAVSSLSALGIIRGDENLYFHPLSITKRSEAAMMIYQSMHLSFE